MKRLTFWCGSALLAGLGVAVSVLAPVNAATKNPLKGMTPVEASKNLPLPVADASAGDAQRGRYLVGLLGCASCHTDGALLGTPVPARTLAGSSIGIAYSNPMVEKFPGAVYPSNLTPDDETGLGAWSEEEIVTLLRSGRTRHGRQTMAIMPWTSYAQLDVSDARAIAAYLKTLEPVRHRVPAAVKPGTPAKTPLVHVGLYRSR